MPGLPQRPGLLLGKILASAAQSSQFQSVREFGTDRQAAIQYGTQMAGAESQLGSQGIGVDAQRWKYVKA